MQLIGFPFFESQAIWIAQLLSGKRTLPSYDDMMQSIKQFYHSKDIAGIPKHNTHDLAEFEVLVFLQQSRSIETNHKLQIFCTQIRFFNLTRFLYVVVL